ncbi:hypothetical protein M3J09_011478 [Ascochyta lentis]
MQLAGSMVLYCQGPLKATIKTVLKHIAHFRICKIDKDVHCKAHDETHSSVGAARRT